MELPQVQNYSDSSIFPCYCDWSDAGGDQVGSICHLNCSPCCGEPCNFIECCYCFFCWTCCYTCNAAKLLASQNEKPCSICNYCLPYWCAGLLSMVGCCIPWCILETFLRHNSRVLIGKGLSSKFLGVYFYFLFSFISLI